MISRGIDNIFSSQRALEKRREREKDQRIRNAAYRMYALIKIAASFGAIEAQKIVEEIEERKE